LLKLLILKFVKNVKVNVVMRQHNIWCVYVRSLWRCVPDCRLQTCILDGHLHRVTYTRCCIDTIDCPDDEHKAARNM